MCARAGGTNKRAGGGEGGLQNFPEWLLHKHSEAYRTQTLQITAHGAPLVKCNFTAALKTRCVPLSLPSLSGVFLRWIFPSITVTPAFADRSEEFSHCVAPRFLKVFSFVVPLFFSLLLFPVFFKKFLFPFFLFLKKFSCLFFSLFPSDGFLFVAFFFSLFSLFIFSSLFLLLFLISVFFLTFSYCFD